MKTNSVSWPQHSSVIHFLSSEAHSHFDLKERFFLTITVNRFRIIGFEQNLWQFEISVSYLLLYGWSLVIVISELKRTQFGGLNTLP